VEQLNFSIAKSKEQAKTSSWLQFKKIKKAEGANRFSSWFS